ncbi:hypothetical protein [Streptomyces sp. G45]|uniref:hypothetical protein n=1 Tax=Streptomyces sp. G45 TaxID=3406627 RepID=UPI003C18B4BB
MQHPAVPELLAHTTTRPIHWVATATAIAAVIAGAAFLQPDHATAAQTAPEPTPKAAAGPAPDPTALHYPLDCGTAEPMVSAKATGDLDADGRPDTVAAVHCAAGSGTPPDGVYVIARNRAGTPRVVATLVDPKDRLTARDLRITGTAVTATLLGYSSPDVPRCCPDRHEKTKWQWKNGAFTRSTSADARSV